MSFYWHFRIAGLKGFYLFWNYQLRHKLPEVAVSLLSYPILERVLQGCLHVNQLCPLVYLSTILLAFAHMFNHGSANTWTPVHEIKWITEYISTVEAFSPIWMLMGILAMYISSHVDSRTQTLQLLPTTWNQASNYNLAGYTKIAINLIFWGRTLKPAQSDCKCHKKEGSKVICTYLLFNYWNL